MKKLMMAVLVMGAGVFGVSAQSFSPRVEVGAAFSNMSVEDFNGKTKIGARAGLAAEIGLTPQSMVSIYLAPGVNYKTGGYNTGLSKGSTEVGNELKNQGGLIGEFHKAIDSSLKGSVGSITTHNISVPVNIGMRVAFGESLALSLEGGPYASYALSTKMGDLDLHELKLVKRFDAGLGVSAALEFSKFYLRVGTEFGMVDQVQVGSLSGGRNKNFYTTVGMRF